MKILILIPVWKRNEILEICIKGIKNLIKQTPQHQFIPLFILSPEDPEIKANHQLVKKYQTIIYTNKQIGAKHNAGINYALKYLEWDYLMNLGSDDIINPQLFSKYYDTLLSQAKPLIAIENLYFFDYYKKQYYFLPNYNGALPIGGARLIDRTIIQWLADHFTNLYDNHINHGLDSNSYQKIKQQTGTTPTIPDIDRFPALIDIKTNTNINHILEIFKLPHLAKTNHSQITDQFPELQSILSARQKKSY